LETTSRGWLYSLLVDGHSLQVTAGENEIDVEGQRYQVEIERDLGIRRSRAVGSERSQIKAPIPGLVVAVHAAIGDAVREGQPLIILEAMKMQMELKSPRSGHVTELAVKPGQEVNQGQALATVGD
jgi:biotin carboxyl carrier protein